MRRVAAIAEMLDGSSANASRKLTAAADQSIEVGQVSFDLRSHALVHGSRLALTTTEKLSLRMGSAVAAVRNACPQFLWSEIACWGRALTARFERDTFVLPKVVRSLDQYTTACSHSGDSFEKSLANSLRARRRPLVDFILA